MPYGLFKEVLINTRESGINPMALVFTEMFISHTVFSSTIVRLTYA